MITAVWTHLQMFPNHFRVKHWILLKPVLGTITYNFWYRPWKGSIKPSLQHFQFCCVGHSLGILFSLFSRNKWLFTCTCTLFWCWFKIKYQLKILYVVIKVANQSKWNYIYVHIYANKKKLKHRRICKICTANICEYYM
jgi:hypothetical protein